MKLDQFCFNKSPLMCGSYHMTKGVYYVYKDCGTELKTVMLSFT